MQPSIKTDISRQAASRTFWRTELLDRQPAGFRAQNKRRQCESLTLLFPRFCLVWVARICYGLRGAKTKWSTCLVFEWALRSLWSPGTFHGFLRNPFAVLAATRAFSPGGFCFTLRFLDLRPTVALANQKIRNQPLLLWAGPAGDWL